MIDYQTLCQAIADWRAGRPPSGPFAAAQAEVQEVDQLDSSAMLVEEVDEVAEHTVAEDGYGDPGTYEEQPVYEGQPAYADDEIEQDVTLDDDD